MGGMSNADMFLLIGLCHLYRKTYFRSESTATENQKSDHKTKLNSIQDIKSCNLTTSLNFQHLTMLWLGKDRLPALTTGLPLILKAREGDSL
jgi:hypothetical protein